MSNPNKFPKIDAPKAGLGVAPMPAPLVDMAAEMKAEKKAAK